MPLKLNSDLPSLSGATEWINEAITSEELHGKPVIVHFWAVSCYLCKNNMQVLQDWKRTYGDQLNFVAVHMPRQQEDMEIEAVKKIASEIGITEACAVDNGHKVKDAFQNEQAWVPAYFLFDAEGKLRSRTAGETGLIMMKATLERLIPTQPVPDEELVAAW